MVAVTELFSTSIASGGGTASGSVDLGRYDQEIRLYLNGDGNSTNLDVSIDSAPEQNGTFHRDETTDVTGSDLTTTPNNAIVLDTSVEAAYSVQVTVTNNAASATTVTAKAVEY